jgi:hypothetical protein
LSSRAVAVVVAVVGDDGADGAVAEDVDVESGGGGVGAVAGSQSDR